jgi:hypothetical protein
MRLPVTISLALLAIVAARAGANAQGAAVRSLPESNPTKPPLEIVSYKIDRDYYPMLDRPSSAAPQMTADVQGLPPVESEQISRQRTRTARGTVAPVAHDETRSRGILSTYLRVIEDAQVMQAVFKNSTDKAVKTVEWDFAFPRYENGALLSRYGVTSPVEIKPGGRKTIKYRLPAGAKKCEVVRVQKTEQGQRASTFEAVCGEGFNDPQLEGQKQQTVSVRKITFVDGTTWIAEK